MNSDVGTTMNRRAMGYTIRSNFMSTIVSPDAAREYMYYAKINGTKKHPLSGDQIVDFLRPHGFENDNIKTLTLRDSITKFRIFGPGFYFYFYFLRFFAIVFFVMMIVSVPSLVINSTGSGIGTKAESFKLLRTVIGNISPTPSDNSEPKEGEWSMSKNEAVYWVELLTDLTYSVIFLVSVIVFKFKVMVEKHKIDQECVTAANFSLHVTNLPDKEFTREDLGNFFANIIDSKIIAINFTYKFNDSLDNFVRLRRFNFKFFKTKRDPDIPEEKQKKILDKLRKQIKKEQEIIKKKTNCTELRKFEDLDIYFTKLEAYVIFNDSLAPFKIYQKYQEAPSWFLCKKDKDSKLEFKGSKLKISDPDYPSNIKFENLEKSNITRAIKLFFIAVLSLAIIFLFFLLNVHLNNRLSNQNLVEVVCDSTTTLQDVLAAKNTSNYDSVQKCFCDNLEITKLITNENWTVCDSYYGQKIVSITLSLLVAIIISLVNILLEIVIGYLVKFVKFSTRSIELSVIIFFSAFMIYVNVIWTAVFMNSRQFYRSVACIASFESCNEVYNLTNNFFDRTWYENISAKIILVLLIYIFLPHLFYTVISKLLFKIQRWWANKATLQISYIKRQMPVLFDIVQGYMFILGVVFSGFTLAGGIPILITFLFFTFVIVYWCHKYLFLYHSSKPLVLNFLIIDYITKTLPLALLIHLGFSIAFFGEDSIFPSRNRNRESIETFGQEIWRRFGNCLPLSIMAVVTMSWMILDLLLYNRISVAFKTWKISKQNISNYTYIDNIKRIRYTSSPTYDFRQVPKFRHLVDIWKSTNISFLGEAESYFGIIQNNNNMSNLADFSMIQSRNRQLTTPQRPINNISVRPSVITNELRRSRTIENRPNEQELIRNSQVGHAHRTPSPRPKRTTHEVDDSPSPPPTNQMPDNSITGYRRALTGQNNANSPRITNSFVVGNTRAQSP
jgi:hypothetical protein